MAERKREKKITKGVRCSRRKTLIITLTEQWISPQRLGALIDEKAIISAYTWLKSQTSGWTSHVGLS